MGCPHKDAQQDCMWMKLAEVEKYLNIHRWTIYRYIHREVQPLPAVKFGGKEYRVCLEMLKDWIEETNA